MNTFQNLTNNFAISLSLLCAIHCLLFPLIILLLPNVVVFQTSNEFFHKLLLIAVIPSSIYSLTFGCKKHQRYLFLFLGALGLVGLISAVVIGGELFEKVMTLLGALFLIIAHYFNYRFCRDNQCQCSD